MLNFCGLIQNFVFTTNHHFNVNGYTFKGRDLTFSSPPFPLPPIQEGNIVILAKVYALGTCELLRMSKHAEEKCG